MRRSVIFALLASVALTPCAAEAASGVPDRHKDYAVTGPAEPGVSGHTVTPDSSIERPGDIGKRAHTNIGIFVPGRRPIGPPRSEPFRR